jgi:hypothetical protein
MPKHNKRQQSFDEDDANSQPSGSPNSSAIAKKPRKATMSRDDSKLDLILKKLVNIEEQNSEIMSKVINIENRVVAAEISIQSVKSDCDSLSLSVHKLQSDMADNSQDPSSISALKSSVSLLLKDSSARRCDQETLYADVNKLNLIVSGILESPHETNTFIAHEVQRLIKDTTGKNITIDVAHSIGKSQPYRIRQIKVRFLSILERNCVYAHRNNLSHPQYINEDLSPDTRSSHALLRRKKYEILQTNKDATIKIDWKHKTLQHGTSFFAIKDGILKPETTSSTAPSHPWMEVNFLGDNLTGTSQTPPPQL